MIIFIVVIERFLVISAVAGFAAVGFAAVSGLAVCGLAGGTVVPGRGILAGTLLAVGQEKMTVEEFVAVTAGCDRSRAGATMPACGLYLNRVIY